MPSLIGHRQWSLYCSKWHHLSESGGYLQPRNNKWLKEFDISTYRRRPQFIQSYSPGVANAHLCLIHGFLDPHESAGIPIGSSVFVELAGVSNTETDI